MISIVQSTLQWMGRGRESVTQPEVVPSPSANVEVDQPQDQGLQETPENPGPAVESGAFTLNISGSRRRRRRRAVPLSDTCKDNLQVMTHCPSHSSNGEAGDDGAAKAGPPSPLSRDGMAVAVALADVICADKETLLSQDRGTEEMAIVSVAPRRNMGDCCPICYETMDDPVFLGCPCRSVFCRPCIQRVHSKGVTEIGARRLCPLCRGRAQTVASVKQLEAAQAQEDDQTRELAKKLLTLLADARREEDPSARHSLLVQSALVLVTLACEARSNVETEANNQYENRVGRRDNDSSN